MSEHRNTVPIIPGFWSDPTICRAGDVFYLANSSFEYFPGAPVHRSTDLVNWEPIGHVVTRPGQADLVSGGASTGLYGSTIRFHDGRFWFITTNITEAGKGQLIFNADDPAGPWTDPVAVPAFGIDPDLAWDEHGTCYLTWRGDGIEQVAIDPATGELLTEAHTIWRGTGMRDAEGPHLYHVDDWWYLVIAEGGTAYGHSVSVARSASPSGPFESNPANPILTHRSLDHPVAAVGHADLVQGPDGWYAVYHGTRPRGGFPQYHLLGRETMLARVEWTDGWPVIVEDDLVAAFRHDWTDDFSGTLDLRWVSPSGSLAGVSTGAGLVLEAVDGSRPIVARVTDHEWTASCSVDVSDGTALLAVRLDDRHWYGVEASADGARAIAQVGPLREVLGSSGPGADVIELRLSARTPAPVNGWPAPQPDLITLTAVIDGAERDLATIDGRYVSTEVAGGFTGRMVGIEAVSGRVTVSHFSYSGGSSS